MLWTGNVHYGLHACNALANRSRLYLGTCIVDLCESFFYFSFSGVSPHMMIWVWNGEFLALSFALSHFSCLHQKVRVTFDAEESSDARALFIFSLLLPFSHVTHIVSLSCGSVFFSQTQFHHVHFSQLEKPRWRPLTSRLPT